MDGANTSLREYHLDHVKNLLKKWVFSRMNIWLFYLKTIGDKHLSQGFLKFDTECVLT